VVGWVDLASPTAPDRIAQLSRNPKLRGLRPMLQSLDDDAWIAARSGVGQEKPFSPTRQKCWWASISTKRSP
jgi:hypothetical protein